MKQTLFLIGPTDIEGQNTTTISHSDDREIRGTANWSGMVPIWEFVTGDSSMRAKSIYGLVGVQKIETGKTANLNIFNLVADADASEKSLKLIQSMEPDLHASRWFNRPQDVLKTSRARLPQTLADIPGCRVPRVFASSATCYDELVMHCNDFGAWPLIVRARGYHSGENTVLLDNSTQLEQIKDLSWLYKGIFLIEFVDYKNSDLLYEKTRVIMVDGVPYPRHSIVSNQWFIHAKNRSDLMHGDDNLRRREAQILANLVDSHGDLFAAIHQRIGLDVFGIDCSVINGQLLVFEANGVMNFLEQGASLTDRYSYLQPHIRAVKRALKKMLMTA